MKEHLVAENPNKDMPHNQRLYRFPNGYGASVVWGGDGLLRGNDERPYELAVIKWLSKTNYYLDSQNPVCNDVIGYQNDEQITDLLNKIKSLERKDTE